MAKPKNDTPVVATRRATKTDQLIALLRAPAGASSEELAEALGWQEHTVRAALSGLRKKGHGIGRGKEGSVTTYRIGDDR